MKKIITIILAISFTLFLTACEEKVEQRTLDCSNEDGFYIEVVVEKDRLISVNEEGDILTREHDVEEILEIEFFIKEEYQDDDFFDFLDDVHDRFTDSEEEAMTCSIETENVSFVEYQNEIDFNGEIGVNAEKDSVLADALAIENAAKLYCSQTTCASDQELTWTELEPYTMGIDNEYFDFTNNSGVLATKEANGWTVDMEADGTGEWELIQDSVPSSCDRDCIIEDID